MSKPSSMSFRRARRWSAEEAGEVLKALQESRLSVSAFARQQGLCAQRIRDWQKRLIATKSGALIAPPQAGFIEVVTHEARTKTVEVVLPSGVVLRVAEAVDVVALRRIVDALEGGARC